MLEIPLTSFFSFSPFSRKVMIMEDPDQNIHLRNLSLQQAANEEEALNLLFLGDPNRMIAEVRRRETGHDDYSSGRYIQPEIIAIKNIIDILMPLL